MGRFIIMCRLPDVDAFVVVDVVDSDERDDVIMGDLHEILLFLCQDHVIVDVHVDSAFVFF